MEEKERKREYIASVFGIFKNFSLPAAISGRCCNFSLSQCDVQVAFCAPYIHRSFPCLVTCQNLYSSVSPVCLYHLVCPLFVPLFFNIVPSFCSDIVYITIIFSTVFLFFHNSCFSFSCSCWRGCVDTKYFFPSVCPICFSPHWFIVYRSMSTAHIYDRECRLMNTTLFKASVITSGPPYMYSGFQCLEAHNRKKK